MNTGPKKPRRGVPVKLYPSDATLAYLRAVAQLSGASLNTVISVLLAASLVQGLQASKVKRT